MRKAKLFLINATILTFSAIIIRTIGVSFNVYISNKIGAEGIGLFQLIMSIYLFAITLATSGISIATTRIVTEEISKGSDKNVKKVVKQSVIYSLIFAIIAGFLLIIFSDFIVHNLLHSKITKKPLYFIALGLPFISMSSAINGYFSAVRKASKTASSQILEQVVKVVITTYILNIFLPGGLENACLSLIIGDVISEVASFSYLYLLYILDKKKLGKETICKESYTKKIFNISFPIAITSYIRSGLSTLKQMIIPIRLEKSGMSCEKALSQYGIITGMVLPIITFPSVLINSFSSLLIPEFSYYYASKNYNQIGRITNRIFKSCFIFSICIFGIFLSFGDKLSLIIYKSTETSFYLMVISPLVILMYIDTLVDGMLKGLNEQVSVMKCNILDLFVSTSFIYISLPLIGINGYVISIFISEILNTTISINQLLKISKTKINYINWIIIPLSGAFLSRYILKFMNITFTGLPSLISEITIFVIIYTVYLFVTSCISKKDFKI